MTLIDENIDLFALVAEEFRRDAERNDTAAGFASDVDHFRETFFGGLLQTGRGIVTVRDEDSSVVAEYRLAEVYRFLTTPRLV